MTNNKILFSMEEILNKHPYNIYIGKDNKWCTTVRDDTKKDHRRRIRRNTREELEDYLFDFYNDITKEDKKYFFKNELERNKILNEIKQDFSLYKEINIWGIREAAYLISPVGDVYSVLKNDWKTQMINDAYGNYKEQKYVMLRLQESGEKRFSVARLTCAMFNGLPPEEMEDPTVDHIDGDPFNNYYKNLRWVSREDNAALRKNRGIGEQNSRAILTQQDVIHICNLLIKKQMDKYEIAQKYGVSVGAIQNIIDKKTWKYITSFFEF